MAKYRKRPIVIDAFKLGTEWPDWWTDAVAKNHVTTHEVAGQDNHSPDYALIRTMAGIVRANYGDWIIRGIDGEIYPCKPDIFEKTYEAAGEE